MKRVEKLLALLNPFSYHFFSLYKYFQFNFDAQNIVCILESYTIHCFSVSNLEILLKNLRCLRMELKSICFVYFKISFPHMFLTRQRWRPLGILTKRKFLYSSGISDTVSCVSIIDKMIKRIIQ